MTTTRTNRPRSNRTGARFRAFGAALLVVALVAFAASSALAQAARPTFDHDSTRFPLTGRHSVANCESCHVDGQFAGTSTNCNTCHRSGGGRAETAPSSKHIPIQTSCGDCHFTRFWEPARMDHATVGGDCHTCHSGRLATAKPPTHIPSSDFCSDCHGTLRWSDAVFDHGAVSDNCFTCHNGTTAIGKHPGHLATSNACEVCHTTTRFVPASNFDHSGIVANCNTCHNNSPIIGKPTNHIPTTGVVPTGDACEACHNTASFSPSTFAHQGITTNCQSCHNGTWATGKDPGHVPTTAVVTGDNCEECHSTVAFLPSTFDHSGTPTDCLSCHNGTFAPGKQPTHIPSNNECELCHSTRAFVPASTFDHTGIVDNCISCHDGTTAPGKNPGHIISGNDCELCHQTHGWIPAGFDHTGITTGCNTCHNGSTATGKPGNHIPTTGVVPTGDACEECHTTAYFSPSTFNHVGITTNCLSCHNGTFAPGKHPTHLPSSNDCEVCHSTTAFVPAGFDHSLVAPGTCRNCHNGIDAIGMTNGHFATTISCDRCHSTVSFLNANFDHVGTAYPGDHRAPLDCLDCHGGNSSAVTWDAPNYQPYCAGCHARDFRPGVDRHRRGGITQNLNCADSGCHNVRDREW